MVRGIKKKLFGASILSLGFLAFMGLIGGGAYAVTSTETTITMDVEPIITVTFSTRAAILKASLKDQLDEIKVGAEIRTNSRTGYKAYLSTDKRRTSDTDTKATGLVHINNNVDYIPTLEESVTPSNFPVNHWGYSIDGGEHYSGMKAVNDVDLADFTSSNSSEKRNIDLYFATKINNDQTNGYYENTIIVTAVANYVAQTINDIQYMQDINDDVALSMAEDQQYQLKDKRDEKKYWISRLRDGNIWMTQNLAYEEYEDANKTQFILTSDLSDVWSDYVYPTTRTVYTTATVVTSSSTSNIYSYQNVRYNKETGAFLALTEEEIAANDEELKHYYLGVRYPGALMKFKRYNQDFNMVGHNSEPEPLREKYDQYVPNYNQSVCPRGWRLPTNVEYVGLPYLYGATKYEYVPTALTNSPAYFFIQDEYYSYYNYKRMITNNSAGSNTRSVLLYEDSTSGFTTDSYWTDGDGFVRCVMRW